MWQCLLFLQLLINQEVLSLVYCHMSMGQHTSLVVLIAAGEIDSMTHSCLSTGDDRVVFLLQVKVYATKRSGVQACHQRKCLDLQLHASVEIASVPFSEVSSHSQFIDGTQHWQACSHVSMSIQLIGVIWSKGI